MRHTRRYRRLLEPFSLLVDARKEAHLEASIRIRARAQGMLRSLDVTASNSFLR